VIVDDLDFCWAFLSPPKTNSELIIYSNTVLTSAVAFQGFQTVSGRWPQELQSVRRVKLRKLPSCNLRDGWEPLRSSGLKQRLRLGTTEAMNHMTSL